MKPLRNFLDQIAPRFAGKTIVIPDPKLDPLKRAQRRMAFRNQIHLHVRPSSTTGERLFSCYSPNAPLPVVSNDQWWSDSWDARQYGRDIDWERPFFKQFIELRSTVPHPARSIVQSENSDYCNNASGLKNCYLAFSATNLQDCTCVDESYEAKDCFDCSNLTHCETCYDCTMCWHCTNLQNAAHCEQCHDSFYLYNCRSCSNCLFCCNLRNEEYCVFNERVGKAEFERILASYKRTSFRVRQQMAKEFETFLQGKPHPHRIGKNTENCTGNYIYNSRNVSNGFMVDDLEDCADCLQVSKQVRSCRDYTQFGLGAELLYECSVCGLDVSRMLFSYECWKGCHNLYYCTFCPGSSDCFGCVGMHRGKYAILNKVYSKQNYEQLVLRLTEHMTRTGEWGEFLPMTLSPTPYNQTLAQRYFPLREEEAVAQGLWWEEMTPPDTPAIASSELPDDLPENSKAIVVKSSVSNIPFSISAHEMRLCRRFKVPLPRMRYQERMQLRAGLLGPLTPRIAKCAKTGQRLSSFVPPERKMSTWHKSVFDREFQ